jgi:transposase
MARAYSDDLRRRVVEAVEGGASCRVAAARYRVSVSFVVKLMQRWRAAATVTAKPVGGQRPYRLAGHAELVQRLVTGRPDLTLEELRGDLAKHGIQVGRSSVDRFLTSLGLTRKKRRGMPASRAAPMLPEPGRPGVPRSRA